MSKLAITYVELKKLRVDPRNARVHPKAQLEQLAASIKEFGFTKPIITDEHHQIIAGHGCLAAAKLLKLDRAPVIVLAGLSKTKRRALALADNRIPLNSTWDDELLAKELRELAGADVDLSALGFNERELERTLNGAGGENGANVEYREGFAVIVELKTESQQTKLLERLTKEGFKCKALVA